MNLGLAWRGAPNDARTRLGPVRRLLLTAFCLALLATIARAEAPGPVTVNVRDFGAIGDGKVHPVNEWIKSGRYRTLHDIQKDYPFVETLGWSIDEVAFQRARQALPVGGGTIYFPAGHYVTAKNPWRILRDDVRLAGDGADRTTLSSAPGVQETLVLAPPRHGGWLEGADREYPFSSDSGRRGDDGVLLKDPAWADDLHEGELVFVRNGGSRFDLDYGEFNEIASVEASGRVHFKHPLARDYTLAHLDWAGETAEDFVMPAAGKSVRVPLKHGEGLARPGADTVVSIGDAIFHVVKPGLLAVHLENPGRGNPPAGTVIRAGAKVALARAVIKLAATVRNFRCERLQILGRRKVLNLSNSYDTAFVDCTFVRDTRTSLLHTGWTIDGDGGRFARFDRCKFVAQPAAGLQFGRSFGNVFFADCTFADTGVAFTAFAFGSELQRCTLEVSGSANLLNAFVAGRSCGDLRFVDNRIRASNLAAVFDTVTDIPPPKDASDGPVLVRGNSIETTNVPALFNPAKPAHVTLEANRVAKR